MNREERIGIFVDEIWSWYGRHKRTLPWRDLAINDDTERAYQVLVSEVMLQQTQVSRVQIVFKNFLSQFASIKDLADAGNADVIIAWRGMGYNSRALRLRDAARTVVRDLNGVFPQELDQLRSIKGIGPYTAAAIRNFAFNIPTPCLDTNIRRIYHRTFFGPENPDGTWPTDDEKLMEIAAQALSVAVQTDSQLAIRNSQFSRSAAEWHAALMDFGSLVCTKVNPRWDICPLTKAGIMKAAYKVKLDKGRGLSRIKKEPGKMEGGRHVPNRIFRGRVVEVLRDEPSGLNLLQIGKRICLHWSKEDAEWLQKLITKLVQDGILEGKKTFKISR